MNKQIAGIWSANPTVVVFRRPIERTNLNEKKIERGECRNWRVIKGRKALKNEKKIAINAFINSFFK